jgi:natural product biosynthesis luciferase-like monooxygenase protein
MRGSKKINSYSLSPMQQGMLFHSQIAPGSGVDIEQIVFELNEQIVVEIFKQAWQKVLHRHAVLRTSFKWEGIDTPIQIVNKDVELKFNLVDYTSFHAEEQFVKLEEFYQKDRKEGFDLAAAPLMRISLFKIAQEKYICVWTFHHILLDGRSFPIIINEFFRIYSNLINKIDDELPLPTPFIEYIKWLEKVDEDKSIVFWKDYLAGFKSRTPLSFDKFDYLPDEPRTGYDVIYHSLSKQLTQSVTEFAKNNSLTPYTLILAAWTLLLYKYSGEEDIVFGATRSCRKNTIENSDDIVGLLINTLPVRVKVNPDENILNWLYQLRQDQIKIRGHEHSHLVKIQNVSELHGDRHLFDSILVFENYLLDSHLRNQGGEWLNRKFKVLEQTNYPITLFGYLDEELLFKLEYDKTRFSKKSAESLNKHLELLLKEIVNGKDKKISDISFITDEEANLLDLWNKTKKDFEKNICIHQLFERMVALHPDKTALSVKNISVSFSELNKIANRTANKLINLGVTENTFVGVFITRSVEMVASILGIHKAGGAYLPLDPDYPSDRIKFMIEDAGTKIIISQPELKNRLLNIDCQILEVDSTFSTLSSEPDGNLELSYSSSNLAYLIYTSGSTGKPKGVMVTHRNVVNFFTGMDDHIKADENSVWLAVTSLSFDISVLELLWTLTRGLQVVLYTGDDLKISKTPESFKSIDFSLFYFSSYEGEKSTDKYKLLLEGSKYADQNNFKAVWTPERHFYDFGGLYPNPSVTSAAIASVTKNIGLRAGSVVSPLHSTIRIAEEWSMVDNLSHGRVGVSFAAGWQPNDFVIMPENFKDRKDLMFKQIDEVKKLWRGEKVGFTNPNNKEIQIGILPRPVQKELPVWVTAAGNPETFEMAGRLGHNLLTHLLGQSISELSEKINIYRKAWKDVGHSGKGILTLMLHTFVGPDENMVKETVRNPMKNYLKSAVNLVKEAAWSFPVFKNATTASDGSFNMDNLTSNDLDAVLDYSFERYYKTSGLFGTPDSCKQIVKNLKEIDVDEIACLIDFGVDSDLVMAHLHYLNQVRREANLQTPVSSGGNNYKIASLIKEQKVTHMQCTPSMAQMLIADEESKKSLASLQSLLIGGEAFPLKLAKNLVDSIDGDVLNMYGPTESTVWSTVFKLKKQIGKTIPIGKPIANTQIYILDDYNQLMPIGVPGELCIGGEGVTFGYYNRTELTAEKFIDNPFTKETNNKIYRTGDLAFFTADGSIEFLGRSDHQVKIRGHRIELGEIEATLSEHQEIREAVVIAREDSEGDVRLVAYIIWKNGSSVQTANLKDYLKVKLPDYMIPSHYLTIDKFPLTPNGKIDRKAFPDYSEYISELTPKNRILPANELEEKIASIWQDLLKMPKVGINDNFFDIGGHSLLAVQLHSRLKEVLGPELTLIDIFTYPTIHTLEEFVNKKSNSKNEILTVHNSKRVAMSKNRINRLKSRNVDYDND